MRIYYANANEDGSIQVLIRREDDGLVDSVRRVVTQGEVFFGYELEELRTALLERGYIDLAAPETVLTEAGSRDGSRAR